MNFHLLSDIFQERNLSVPEFDFLAQDNALYDTLLFQPKENIVGENDCIQTDDRGRTIDKFTSFFQLAQDENVDLAVTPEYSCPCYKSQRIWSSWK